MADLPVTGETITFEPYDSDALRAETDPVQVRVHECIPGTYGMWTVRGMQLNGNRIGQVVDVRAPIRTIEARRLHRL